MKPAWKRIINHMTNEERYRSLCAAIEHLIDIQEVRCRIDGDYPCSEEGECIYWSATGEDICKWEDRDTTH